MKSIRSLLASALVATTLVSSPLFAETAKPVDAAKPVAVQTAAVTPVNINSADAQTIADRLNGVGLKKAQAIVTYREQHGPFKAAEELVNVAGIGTATLEKNRSAISVN